MDAVSAATFASQPTPAPAAEPVPASTGGALQSGADFQTFLTLLTTQLKNQDPLNPQDGAEFVAQLAQFSAVEQQIKGNETLDAILSAVGDGPAELAPWIGKRVEAPAPLPFDGETPVELSFDAAEGATSANLVVKTEAGVTVARLPLVPGATSFAWNGDAGTAPDAGPGTYVFSVERKKGDAALPTVAARGFADVTEARLGAKGVELVLEGGGRVNAEKVTAIRAAAG